jgi:hypothetical protein
VLALVAALLLPPVPGEVTRAFDVGANPFAPGQHRGADFAAAPGAPVRASCAGTVEVAGRVGTSGRLVTILCGRRRVTAMPLARVSVRAGDKVRRGARIGIVAPTTAHDGLHLGVRREGERFGYLDPGPLLAADRRPPPITGPPPGRPATRRLPPARDAPPITFPTGAPLAPAHAPPARVTAPAHAVGSSPAAAAPGGGVAPWPVWAGLALALSGALGATVAGGARTRRAARPRPSPEQVASPP